MNRIQLGVALETAGLPFRQALDAAARASVRGVQADAVGELDPTRLGDTGRRELRTLLRGANLELTALNCPLRRGLDNAESLQARLEHLVKVMQLASDLGPRVVLMPMPRVPPTVEGQADAATPRAVTMRESLAYLSHAADRLGVTVALEPGLDTAEATLDYLQTFDTGALAVNFDPANFLINGHDPVKAVTHLRDRLAHMNARDARTHTVSGGPKEVPVGTGDIDWLLFAAVLESVGYRRSLVVDQENGTSRWPDVVSGVNFLRRILPAAP